MGNRPKTKRIVVERALDSITDLLLDTYEIVEVCGSLRRGLSMVSDADLVCVGHCDDLASLLNVDGIVEWTGGPRRSFDIGRVRFDVWEVTLDRLGAAMLYCTGPALANVVMRRWAKSRGFRLGFDGLWRGDELVAARTEEEICDVIGWTLVPPEERFEDDRYYGRYLDVLNKTS